MYDELVAWLRSWSELPTHCERYESCEECDKQDLCSTYTNERIIAKAKEAADAIEELSRICDAMKPKYDAVCVKCAYYAEAEYNDKGFLICPASGMAITALDFCSYFELPEPPKEETIS